MNEWTTFQRLKIACLRARAIALSFSGGTLGGVAAPFIAVPIGLHYGWRAAFLFTGALGLGWMVLWAESTSR